MYAMKIRPVFKDYLWGGERLEKEFGFKSKFAKTAEAWILSVHGDGESVIENGDYKGRTLGSVLSEHNDFIKKGYSGDFPLLIKFIDARDKLSLQVHPYEQYAVINENDHGKTEAWYILDADENAELILGFKKDISKDEFINAVENDTVGDIVSRNKVKKGETYLIEAGTIHAIGSGILICEVQQNSNVTYRVYDYGRVQNGKKRPLHIEKAVQVLNFKPYSCENKPLSINENKKNLITCDIFILNKININGKEDFFCDGNSFVSLVCIDGVGEISLNGEKTTLCKGESVFIPASSGEFTVHGNLTVLETKIP